MSKEDGGEGERCFEEKTDKGARSGARPGTYLSLCQCEACPYRYLCLGSRFSAVARQEVKASNKDGRLTMHFWLCLWVKESLGLVAARAGGHSEDDRHAVK